MNKFKIIVVKNDINFHGRVFDMPAGVEQHYIYIRLRYDLLTNFVFIFIFFP